MRSSRARRITRLQIESLEQREVPASIAGRVFLDFDNSGKFNGPDTGIQGVTLTLSGGGLTTPATTQTDAQGNYSFTSLTPGTYSLTETQPTSPANQSGTTRAGSAGGDTSTTNVISQIRLSTNTAATGYTFGEVPIVSTGGTVYEDLNGNGTIDSGETGIPNVSVTLTGTSVMTHAAITPITVTTNSQGVYAFANLAPGTYTITETQPVGFSDGKDTNGTPAAASVSNDKFAGINLTGTSTASGGFNFGEIHGGTIGGVVFSDVDNDGVKEATGEPGIPGVRLVLTGQTTTGHHVSMSTTTGADGTYSFGNLQPGTYTVREIQPRSFADGKETAGSLGGDATAKNDQISGINFTSGATATDYAFGEVARADLRLSQTPPLTSTSPGGRVTITYTLRNIGSAAATASTVDVKFGGLRFVSTSDSTKFNSTTKKWTVGDLAAGASATIKITYRTPGFGTFVPSAKAATTATELLTKNNGSASTVLVGVAAPTPSLAFPNLSPELGAFGAAFMLQGLGNDLGWMTSPSARPFVQQFFTNAYQSSMSFLSGSGGSPLAGLAQMNASIASQIGNSLGFEVAPPNPVVTPVHHAPNDSGMTNTMPSVTDSHWVPGANGLKTWDIESGKGTPVATGDKISVFYTGWLASNGTKFDSRRSPAAAADFTLANLIQGWQQGIVGMKPGGIRRLSIPSALGYGAAGSPPNIPANADLVFEIKLISRHA